VTPTAQAELEHALRHAAMYCQAAIEHLEEAVRLLARATTNGSIDEEEERC
jgi:hypothetical protein